MTICTKCNEDITYCNCSKGWTRRVFLGALVALVVPSRRTRPAFNITGTRTGRLSSTHPNIMEYAKRSSFARAYGVGINPDYYRVIHIDLAKADSASAVQHVQVWKQHLHNLSTTTETLST